MSQSNALTPVLIMGNGPSAKLIDFARVEDIGFASVGMNAAYRFWDRHDFRPTYFICMDAVLIKSHVHRIHELVEEGRVKKFFLRDEYKESFPEHANHPRIQWFADMRSRKDSIFDTNMITTGSWALRWMANEGHHHIATIGIDANYVELIKEAKRLGTDKDLRLEVKSTPSFNPNYFFSDYQRQGDQYNVPNSPDYLQQTGQLVHVEALKRARDEISKKFPTVRISDCSPIATHGVFPKASIDRFLSFGDVAIITSFHSGAEDDDIQNYLAIAVENASQPRVDSVRILFEGKRASLNARIPADLLFKVRQCEGRGTLKFIEIDSRPNYHQLFGAGRNAGAQIAAVVNADILLTQEFLTQLCANFNQPTARLLALTRWNETANGLFIQGQSAAPPWPEIALKDSGYKHQNFLSFDAYIFNRGLPEIAALQDVFIGTFGCDTAIAALHRLAGIPVVNPCLSYKTVHRDNKHRNYAMEAGTKQMLKNTASVVARLQTVLRRRDAMSETISAIESLRPSIVSIGTPMHRHGPGHALFRLLGAVPWTQTINPQRIDFVSISFNPATDTDEQLRERAQEIQKAIDRNAFVEIEVSGNNGDYYLGSIRDIPETRQIKDRLKYYAWQSVIYKDKATPTEATVHADMLLVAKQSLGLQDANPFLPQLRDPWRVLNSAEVQSHRYDRVLVIDSTPVGHGSATGQIKKVFLEGWPRENILQVWQEGGVNGALKLNRYDADGKAVPVEAPKLNVMMEECLRFSPNAVYLRPIDSAPLLEFASEYIKRRPTALVVHMMDDWPMYLRHANIKEYERLNPLLLELVNHAGIRLSISQKMADEYALRYGAEWVPLANGIDVEAQPSKDWSNRPAVSRSAPFCIRYMGGMAKNMNFQSVVSFARAVANMSATTPVTFEIYTMPWYFDVAMDALKGLPSVSVHRLVDDEAYFETLASADALLIAYNFDPDSMAYTSLSLANKLPECLAAGVPVIGYGPNQIATIDVLRGTGGGLVVDRPELEFVTDAILSLISNRDKSERLGRLGRVFAKKNLSRAAVATRFRALMAAAADAAPQGSAKKLQLVESAAAPTGRPEAAAAVQLAPQVGNASTAAEDEATILKAMLDVQARSSISNARLLRFKNRHSKSHAIIVGQTVDDAWFAAHQPKLKSSTVFSVPKTHGVLVRAGVIPAYLVALNVPNDETLQPGPDLGRTVLLSPHGAAGQVPNTGAMNFQFNCLRPSAAGFEFSTNAASYIVDVGDEAYLCLQLAYFMGFSEVECVVPAATGGEPSAVLSGDNDRARLVKVFEFGKKKLSFVQSN